MYVGTMAEAFPDRDAVVIGDGEVVLSYAELEARSNQVAHAFRDLGLDVGDTVAVMLENCVEFYDVWWAAMRSGLYLTPINWRLTAPEVEYLVTDSEARAVVFSAGLGEIVDAAVTPDSATNLIAVGDSPVARAFEYDALRAGQPEIRLPAETEGSQLFYSSGTTGRPKGIKRRLSGEAPDVKRSRMRWTAERFGLEPGCRYLSAGPLYHSAPALWSNSVHTVGGTAVVMRRFDPEDALALIDHQHVTDAQFVPTMLHRMLRLPEEVRNRYDLSSLRRAWTAAAPISVDTKRQMIDWWGDRMLEYYASSEGGGTMITAAEWLERPGSVGRAYPGATIYVLDPVTHEEVPPREQGVVYFTTAPGAAFVYHNDPSKTAESHHGDLFTAGDIGYLDDDGYLFLTDRQGSMIISGGVNIYPREVEDAIESHPAVADVAVFGLPDEDLGEKTHAAIQPLDPDADPDELVEEVKAFLATRLARQKIPRSFEVVTEFPRDENGKLYKRRLRDAHLT